MYDNVANSGSKTRKCTVKRAQIGIFIVFFSLQLKLIKKCVCNFSVTYCKSHIKVLYWLLESIFI